jgi:hypothetical protein
VQRMIFIVSQRRDPSIFDLRQQSAVGLADAAKGMHFLSGHGSPPGGRQQLADIGLLDPGSPLGASGLTFCPIDALPAAE